MEGHYDLIGPDGEIVLPQVWDKMVQPDWIVEMQMWPIPELERTKRPQPSPPFPAGNLPSIDESIRNMGGPRSKDKKKGKTVVPPPPIGGGRALSTSSRIDTRNSSAVRTPFVQFCVWFPESILLN